MTKLAVIFKDPDALYDAIQNSVDDELKDMDEDEREAVKEIRVEKYSAIAAKWFEYGEYLTVVIDTEANTCVVQEGKE